MTRFTPNPSRPDHLVASVLALADGARDAVLDGAMAAVRADEAGDLSAAVDRVCHAAVTAGVAAGEIAWLVGELESAGSDAGLLAEAGDAVSALETCTRAVGQCFQDLADRGGPAEITAAADALRRVSLALTALLPRLHPVG